MQSLQFTGCWLVCGEWCLVDIGAECSLVCGRPEQFPDPRDALMAVMAKWLR